MKHCIWYKETCSMKSRTYPMMPHRISPPPFIINIKCLCFWVKAAASVDVDGFHCESFSWWREKKTLTLTLDYLIQKITLSFDLFSLGLLLFYCKWNSYFFFFKSHLFLKKEILCLIFLHRSNVENRRIFPCSSEPRLSTGFHFQAVVKLAATRGR